MHPENRRKEIPDAARQSLVHLPMRTFLALADPKAAASDPPPSPPEEQFDFREAKGIGSLVIVHLMGGAEHLIAVYAGVGQALSGA